MGSSQKTWFLSILTLASADVGSSLHSVGSNRAPDECFGPPHNDVCKPPDSSLGDELSYATAQHQMQDATWMLQVASAFHRRHATQQATSNKVAFTFENLWQAALDCVAGPSFFATWTESYHNAGDRDAAVWVHHPHPNRRYAAVLQASDALVYTGADAAIFINQAAFVLNGAADSLEGPEFDSFVESIRSGRAETEMETESQVGSIPISADGKLLAKGQFPWECTNFLKYYQSPEPKPHLLNAAIAMMQQPVHIPPEDLVQVCQQKNPDEPIVGLFYNIEAAFSEYDMKFDLKGSSWRRKNKVKPDAAKQSFKDGNFLEQFPSGLRVSNDDYLAVSDAVYDAAMWLYKRDLIDYSLMLYVKKLEGVEDEADVRAHIRFEQGLVEAQMAQVEAGQGHGGLFPMQIPMFDPEGGGWYVGLIGGIIDNLETYENKMEFKHRLLAKARDDYSIKKPWQYACRFALYVPRVVILPTSGVPRSPDGVHLHDIESIQEYCNQIKETALVNMDPWNGLDPVAETPSTYPVYHPPSYEEATAYAPP